MRKGTRYLALILGILMVLSLFAGCSSMVSKEETSTDGAAPQTAESPAEAPASEQYGEAVRDSGLGTPGLDNSIEPDKIITTISMTFETTTFDQSLEKLYSLIEESGGYLSSSNVYYSSYYDSQMYQRGDFAIRIPRDKVNQFKGLVPQIGNLTNESTSKEDVTRYYTDTESRLKVLEIKEERLLSLLERAEAIEDIIKLEDQLSEVIYEKENLKATLVNLDDRIDYSTFHVSLIEVAKVSTTETKETTFLTRIQNAFENSLYQFRRSAENLAIFLVYNLPGLLVILIVAIILYKIVKRILRGPERGPKEKKNKNKPRDDRYVEKEDAKDEKKDDSQA
ncbi:DUF4349 domain-containing protein [Gudongella sp. DL1XJH-153]|uniref:DUF4349 domain-containing protein n=1 Tax=Gudongella sp. DL1XJH-153 TaxID=3409804 RepID=UPI003BB63663